MSSQAVARSFEFNAQEMALAKMGVPTNTTLVQAMSTRALSHISSFNTQCIANLLWALGTTGIALDSEMVRVMLTRFSDMNGDMKQRQQIHLFFLSNSLSPNPIDITFWAGLAQLCKAAFVSQSLSNTRFSNVKQDLKRVLRMLVPEEVLEEQVLDYSWFLVDVQLAGTKVIILLSCARPEGHAGDAGDEWEHQLQALLPGCTRLDGAACAFARLGDNEFRHRQGQLFESITGIARARPVNVAASYTLRIRRSRKFMFWILSRVHFIDMKTMK
jgi:type IV secretory pathway VirB3-like protein